MQVASRLLLVWGVVNIFPSLGRSAIYSSMLYAWSVTEVIRYSFFVVTLSGYQPGFIKWLRYNAFFVLYPLGISSECYLIWRGVQKAKESQKISYGQELAWSYQLILFIYIPGTLV
jgi:very-long-chain (3R)-3-hydroxyacyl-CoA dehydratase